MAGPIGSNSILARVIEVSLLIQELPTCVIYDHIPMFLPRGPTCRTDA